MNTNEIAKNSADISLEVAASPQFCQVWPSAKKGLELLKDIVKNPFVKLAISGIIAAGDAVSSQICQ